MASSHDATSRTDQSQGLVPSCVPTLKTTFRESLSSWAEFTVPRSSTLGYLKGQFCPRFLLRSGRPGSQSRGGHTFWRLLWVFAHWRGQFEAALKSRLTMCPRRLVLLRELVGDVVCCSLLICIVLEDYMIWPGDHCSRDARGNESTASSLLLTEHVGWR